MSLSKLNQLSFKLPAFVAIVIAIVASVLSTFTYLSGQAATAKGAENRLSLILENRENALTEWYTQLTILSQSLARNPSTIEAATNLNALWSILEPADRAAVRADFTENNPFEHAKRAELLSANDMRGYDRLHAKYHEFFKYYNNSNNFYDLFLINPEGEIIYSVAKEADFAQNVVTGDLAQTGIGESYRQAVDNPSEATHLSHFRPYAVSAGAIAAFASTRIENEAGELKGVLVLQTNQAEFTALINKANGMGETGETFLVGPDGRLIVSSRFESGPQAMDIVEMTPKVSAGIDGDTFSSLDTIGLNNASVLAQTVPITFDDQRYALIAEISRDEVFHNLNEQLNTLLLISFIAAAVMSLLAWLYINRVTSALKTLGGEMGEIANGDFEVEVSATKRGDEIGKIGQTLVDFREKLEIASQERAQQETAQQEQKRTLDVLSSGLVQLADGDLSSTIDQQFAPQYESLRSDFNAALRVLSEAISSVTEASGSIQHGAQEISQASDDLSNRTENQAATLEQTAAALDELTASVKSAADGAKSVETIVVEAQSEAEASGKIVSDAISAMNQIEESSKHISQIISVIDDIAFQTNLLALNAGVEAARAGDAGKGFAVVASEVRALAQRSSEAAKEIKTLISGSATEVERGVELVGGAGEALSSIVQRVSHISDLVRTMATGTSEQAVGLGEINIGVNQLDQVTQQNAAMVEEATAASHVLKGDAVRLEELVRRFKTANGGGGAVGQAAATFHRSSANVEHVQFQPATEVEFTPTQGDMPIEHKATGTTDKAPADNDWIDF
ncbi:methyl-accepting chemotaxis protein [Sulfitobacter sp. HNIBRBA2951]|uniref:methyl-accepting chemotaxis protein n=1 Tax=Sulfitobacter aquimarinus TaxID=3158557 RepID=UPI0032DFAC9E